MKLTKKLFILLISIIFLFPFFLNAQLNIMTQETYSSQQIYGITIDDSGYDDKIQSEIVEAIRLLPTKPTVRIVMSADIPLENYKILFQKLNKVAFIMATPVDSSEMINYKTVHSYTDRFINSYNELSEYVDIWEIGNEINGENWLGGNNKIIIDKIIAAYSFIAGKNAKTALTAYYFSPGMQKVSMHDWLNKYIPAIMKNKLDYLFVSYYEDDNNGYIPNWSAIFIELEKSFPNTKLGIGECGTTHINQKKDKLWYYYTMPKYTTNYVGGYFWWYWVQDAVPYQNNTFWIEFYKLGENNYKN